MIYGTDDEPIRNVPTSKAERAAFVADSHKELVPHFRKDASTAVLDHVYVELELADAGRNAAVHQKSLEHTAGPRRIEDLAGGRLQELAARVRVSGSIDRSAGAVLHRPAMRRGIHGWGRREGVSYPRKTACLVVLPCYEDLW